MATIKVGDKIPSGIFQYVPYTPDLADVKACGKPVNLSTDAWKGKKVVLFSVPGAFTPTCHVSHLPGYIAKYKEIKSKGVDVVACLAYNDAWVMSAWGRAAGVTDEILMLSDTGATWSGQIGLTLGERTGRYALVVDDLVVTSINVETNPSALEVSGAEHVLPKL